MYSLNRIFNQLIESKDPKLAEELYIYCLHTNIPELAETVREVIIEKNDSDVRRAIEVFIGQKLFDYTPTFEREFIALFKHDSSADFVSAVNAAVEQFFEILPERDTSDTIQMNQFRNSGWRAEDPVRVFGKINALYKQAYEADFEQAFDQALSTFRQNYKH